MANSAIMLIVAPSLLKTSWLGWREGSALLWAKARMSFVFKQKDSRTIGKDCDLQQSIENNF